MNLRRYKTVNPEAVGSSPAKTPKNENSDLHGFEVNRPSSKCTQLLFQVMKVIINQSPCANYKTNILHAWNILYIYDT